MSLTLEASLRAVAETLRTRIVPALDDPFALEAARLAAQVLAIAANAVDGAAALRVAENAALRDLFARAEGVACDAGLAARSSAAATSRDPDLTLSGLDAENARLRALLIELHADMETRDDPSARDLDGRIWRTLQQIEANRAPQL